MKTNFKYAFMAMVALSMGLTSCSKDDDATTGVDEGASAQLTVSIAFPAAGHTRATTTADENATDAEAAVTKVDVYLYTAGGEYISHTPLEASDFSQGAAGTESDTYTASKTISTTTGEKNIYVGVNLPGDIATALEGWSMNDMATKATEMTRAQMTNTTAGLPMFSKTVANTTLVADKTAASNTVAVTVQRLVAKVTVESAAKMEQAGAAGTLGALEFAIYNFNQRQFMMQGEAPFKDPNWAIGSALPTIDLDVTQNPVGDLEANPTASDWKTVLKRTEGDSPAITAYAAAYASENTSEGKRKGEVTRATVRATFIPKNITVYAEGTDNTKGYKIIENPDLSTVATFYSVTPSVGAATAYFTDNAVATQFAADNNATVTEFTGGYCYWHMYLNKNQKNQDGTAHANIQDVLRNDYLKCNITRIVVPGRNTPLITSPEDMAEAETDTEITTNIEVLFWNTPILNDYSLEP